jgi:hypothetical protein
LPWKAVKSIEGGQSILLGQTLYLTTAKGRRIFLYGPDSIHFRLNPRAAKRVEEYSQFLTALRTKALEYGVRDEQRSFWQTPMGQLRATLTVIAVWLFAALQIYLSPFPIVSAVLLGLCALALTIRAALLVRNSLEKSMHPSA